MKTEQTNARAGGTAGKAGACKPIDFRKDTPPTDWLMKRVEERYAHLPVAEIKLPVDYHKEFIAELDELRCGPNCANSQPTNGQLAPGCICSLLKEMTSDQAPLVPRGEFVAVVQAAGYSQEDTLEHYRNYTWTKLHEERKEDFRRLIQESDNAYNWWLELESDEAKAQASAAENELKALERKIDQELEAIMSA